VDILTETRLRVSRYPPHRRMTPHRHKEASLCLVVDGGYREKVKGVEHEHGPGHILFYPPHAVHSQCFGPKGAGKIIFTPTTGWLGHLDRHRPDLADAPYSQDIVFRQLGSRLLAELQNDDDCSPLALEGLLLEVIAAFCRHTIRDRSPPAWLRAARDLIHDRCFERCTMTQVAASVGRHPMHLAREFRRFYGATIGAYQRHLRVEQAAILLLQKPGGSLTDIALTCGFASHSHLCRVFKAAYGVSPAQYRDQR
jgi:AraC family transcriptional regulator